MKKKSRKPKPSHPWKGFGSFKFGKCSPPLSEPTKKFLRELDEFEKRSRKSRLLVK